MAAMLVGLLMCSALAAPLVGPPAHERVFLAPLRTGDDVDVTTRQSLEGAVLVAAKRAGITVIGAGDVQALLDVEAAKQAAGCSADSCAAELADALGAPQLLTGQVAHLGDTWVLTLTHLERANMQVLGRAQVSQTGTSAAVLLPLVDRVTNEVLGLAPAPASPLVMAGVGVGVGGVVVGGLGALLWGYTAGRFDDGVDLVNDGDLAGAQKIRDENEGLYYAGIVGVGVGVAAIVAGTGLVAGGLLSEGGL